jgi:uncharacterized membrane protein
MMTLVFLTFILLGSFALLTLADRIIPGVDVSVRTRARVGLTALLLVTSSAHFMRARPMAEMLPSWVPLRVPIVHATGVLEVLAAIGVWVPAVSGIVGAGLMVMLILFLPANVYAAFNHVPFGGHETGPLYLFVRVPFQFLVIAWTWISAGYSDDRIWIGEGAIRSLLMVRSDHGQGLASHTSDA